MTPELGNTLDNLTSTYSPEDVLDIYGTMKAITEDVKIRQVVPNDIEELDARLGMFMYSTPKDRTRSMV